MEHTENTESNNNVVHPRIKLSPSQLGLIIIILGAFELIVGIFSWFFTIPLFSLFYIAEIIGIIFIVIGIKQYFKGRK